MAPIVGSERVGEWREKAPDHPLSCLDAGGRRPFAEIVEILHSLRIMISVIEMTVSIFLASAPGLVRI